MHLLITKNNDTIRAAMNALPGTELIASQGDFIVWVWRDAEEAKLAAVQAHPDYIGSVQMP